jgi:hypothetical protein
MAGRPRKRARELTKLYEEATRLTQAMLAAYRPSKKERAELYVFATDAYLQAQRSTDYGQREGPWAELNWNTAIDAISLAVEGLHEAAHVACRKAGLSPPAAFPFDKARVAKGLPRINDEESFDDDDAAMPGDDESLDDVDDDELPDALEDCEESDETEADCPAKD